MTKELVPLDDLARAINSAHKATVAHMSKTVKDAIRTGSN